MSFQSQLSAFMAAIRQRESSNNYQIVNDKTHPKYGNARGAYQIMSKIWDGWAREAGLAGANWRDPAAQDAVAAHKMTQYYNEYKDWYLVAAAWHGGTGAADALARGGTWGTDMDGTATADYSRQVLGLMGQDVNASDRAMINSSVAQVATGRENPLEVQGAAFPEGRDPRSELRKTYSEVLDSMSQVIASNPGKYGSMYDQLIPDEALIGEGA